MSKVTCGPIIMGLNNKDEVTLRDYFAAKAMQALLAKTGWSDFKDITKGAYVIADDMLKEREIER